MENNCNIEDANEVYFNSLPPGYRFCPTDEELINVYLKKKVLNEILPRNQIRDFYFYEYSPQILSKMFKLRRESVWYFFSQRIKKYPKGTRPDRSVHDEGFWKPMGADVPIYSNGEEIGCKKSLVFFKGSTGKGKRKGKGMEKAEEKEVEPPVKTNWMMHEYRYGKRADPRPSTNPDDKELDKWVLCKMYEKAAGKANGEQQHEDNGSIIIDNEGVVLLPNTNAQPVLVQDPQFPPQPPTTLNTMSSAMLTYLRYGYGYGVPIDGVALPNRLNLNSPLFLDDDLSDYITSIDSLVADDDDMMPALPSDTTHLELSSDVNKGGPS